MSATFDSPSTFCSVISLQFGVTQWVLKKNCEAITHEQSLVRPEPGVNSLNWLLGHILTVRNILIPIAGGEPFWSESKAAPYSRGGHGDPEQQITQFEDLLALLDRSHETLLERIRGLGADELGAKSPFSPGNDPTETVGSVLAKSAFHESYHSGQTGTTRRLLGLPGAIR